MVRRVVEHKGKSIDDETLTVLTIFETGVSKEVVKRVNEYSKKHYVLVNQDGDYNWK